MAELMFRVCAIKWADCQRLGWNKNKSDNTGRLVHIRQRRAGTVYVASRVQPGSADYQVEKALCVMSTFTFTVLFEGGESTCTRVNHYTACNGVGIIKANRLLLFLTRKKLASVS